MSDAVLIEHVRPGIVVLTLNRPQRLNAMNYDLVRGLYDALDELETDRSCRVIVLTGAGRGFCAGLDLSEGASPPTAAGLGRAQAGMTVQKMIAGLVPKMRSVPQLETAELIVGNSPFGVRMTKEVMWSQLEIGSLQAGIDLENRTQVLSSFTGDLAEAMAAFVEKRPPTFNDA